VLVKKYDRGDIPKMVEVTSEDRMMAKMYERVVFKYMNKILEAEDGMERRELLRRQGSRLSQSEPENSGHRKIHV